MNLIDLVPIQIEIMCCLDQKRRLFHILISSVLFCLDIKSTVFPYDALRRVSDELKEKVGDRNIMQVGKNKEGEIRVMK